MGAFFLYKKEFENDIDIENVKNTFKNKGFSSANVFDLNEHKLIIYPKILINNKNFWHDEEGNIIFVVGTIIYKYFSYNDAIKKIYDDFKNNLLNFRDLKGLFTILIYHKQKLYLLTDILNQYQIYIYQKYGILSSSFLAIFTSLKTKLTLNKKSIVENIVSGCIYDNDTIIDNIYRFDYTYIKSIPDININIIPHKKINSGVIPTELSFKESIDSSINVVNDFLKQISHYVSKYGIDIGISGGFDSRLIFGFLLKIFSKNLITLHSHWKKPPDKDLLIARKIAEYSKINLVEIPITPYYEMSESQLIQNLNNSMTFYDGQFRVNHSWLNPYRSVEYRKAILKKCGFGITGLCGEQFRNHFYLSKNKISLNNWIKNYVIGYYPFNTIKFKSLKDEIIEKIKSSIEVKIKLNGKKHLSHIDIKRYYAEMWVPSGPGIRNSIENQISYFLSPFMEYDIIINGYKIIRHLGIYDKFQANMIINIDPNLAKIESNDGNFSKRPYKKLLSIYLVNLFGSKTISYLKYLKHCLNRIESHRISKLKDIGYIKQIIQIVEDLELDIDINKLSYFETPFSRIIALGHFIKSNQSKLSF